MSSHRRRGVVAPWWALLAVLASTPALAQNVGTISGVVNDAQGLPVPGATVTIENRISRVTQHTDTDMDGRFILANVAFGTYVMSTTLEGFAPARDVVEVRSSVPIERNVSLVLGSLAETVTVSADSLLERSAVGSHVDIGSVLIDRMPSATPSKQLSAMLLSAPGFIPSL
ncbi:MAG: carboxypeptidase-like regulatory domain-containing protein, partial [Vicinamibacterales bacterium]